MAGTYKQPTDDSDSKANKTLTNFLIQWVTEKQRIRKD